METAGRRFESNVVPASVTRGTEVEVAHQANTGEAREKNKKGAKQEEPEDNASPAGMRILHTTSMIVTQSCPPWFA